MQEKQVEEGSVVIDGVNYPLSEMNERQLYLVAQLQEIQGEKKRAIATLDRIMSPSPALHPSSRRR